MNNPEVFSAPQVEYDGHRSSKWESERASFLKLLPSLLETHLESYVAIHDGQIVDSGEDQVTVALRVYQRFGYVPIYVGLVTETLQSPRRLPSPRLASRASD